MNEGKSTSSIFIIQVISPLSTSKHNYHFVCRSDLVCRVKYCNTLPDIPFDPKFLKYPFAMNRFIEYKPTSLERNYKYDVLTELDLGVDIDLITPDVYTVTGNEVLDPADEKLLEEDIIPHQDSRRFVSVYHGAIYQRLNAIDVCICVCRSRHHAQSVSWLRRTEYISTEQTRFQPMNIDKVEAKVGFSIKKNFKVIRPPKYSLHVFSFEYEIILRACIMITR